MTAPVTIVVRGRPAPQGSKRAFAVRGKGGVPTGRVAVVESSHDRVRSWRAAVIDACDGYGGSLLAGACTPLDGPLSVSMTFYLPRPKGHYGTGRNAAVLRPGAPSLPAGKPDTDKLARATGDALTDAGIWRDDGQVTDLHLVKRYADGNFVPGALITIRPAL